ncbi:MAG: ATP-binding protein [Myxococcota bacterium]|nr:ATP-binding protein [Myxococcota bacterium]
MNPAAAHSDTHNRFEFERNLSTPVEADSVPSATQSMLRSSLRMLIFGTLTLLCITPFLGNGTLLSSLGIYLPLSLVFFGLLKLEERGHPHLAAWALSLSLFSAICLGVLFFGGIIHHTAVVFSTVIILAALTIGARAAIFFCILCGTAIVALVKADQFGMTPTPLIPVSVEGTLSSTLLNLGIVAFIMRRAVIQLDLAGKKLSVARNGLDIHAKSLQRLHGQLRERARIARNISEIARTVVHGDFEEWRTKAIEGIRSLFNAKAVGVYQSPVGSEVHLAEWRGEKGWGEASGWDTFRAHYNTMCPGESYGYLTRESHPDAFVGISETVAALLIISIPGRSHSLGGAVVVLREELYISSGLAKDLQTLGSILGSSMERSAAEQKMRIAQRMETVGRLAGSIAHDFNNLLTTIMGSSQLLLEESGRSEPDRDLLEDIGRAADHAALLTRKLLVLSRKQVVLLEPVDLNESTQAFAQMANRMVGEKIQVEFSPLDSEAFVTADPSNVEQILLNLTVNARDAMPEGGEIKIALDRIQRSESPLPYDDSSAAENILALKFSDTGSGMSPHVLSHLFEPFFTTKQSGTGLGLASVQEALEDLNGSVRVESAPGRGTTFLIFIPEQVIVVRPSDPALHRKLSSPEGEKILLVDDNNHVRKTLTQVLQKAGYNVAVAHNGLAAKVIINSSTTSFDLILTDIVMPNFSGIDLASWLRETAVSTPVLFMSGFADSTQKEIGILGEFISKPFTSFKLLNRIELLLASNTVRMSPQQPTAAPASQAPPGHPESFPPAP